MTAEPGRGDDDLAGLLRALVQEARQHTVLLARLVDELAGLRQAAPGAAEPSRPAAEPPLDVLDLAAVLPERGGGVHLHASPDGAAPPLVTVGAGSIVRVLEEGDGWALVATRDGTRGWVRLGELGEV